MPSKKGAATSSTALQLWEKEMAEAVDKEASAAATGRSGSKRVGTRAGFSIDGEKAGTTLDVIVVAWVFENDWYEVAYDSDNPTSPSCFAFGETDRKAMFPHPNSFKLQSPEGCAVCPKNQFGSADTGRGKACKNVVKLVVALAKDAKDIAKAEKRTLSIPPTSAGFFSTYIEELKTAIKRPSYMVVTKFTWEANAETQFTIKPELKDKLPMELYPAIKAANAAEMKLITTPYDPPAAPAPKSAKAKTGGKFSQAQAPAKAGKGKR